MKGDEEGRGRNYGKITDNIEAPMIDGQVFGNKDAASMTSRWQRERVGRR